MDIQKFQEKLQQYAHSCIENAQKCKGAEESTKHSLVMPFLSLLGYDFHNPNEVIPEYDVGFASKLKVDYVICHNGEPALIIEVKAVGTEITSHKGDKHRRQLQGYFTAVTEANIGILANGLEYQFFIGHNGNGCMNDVPFFVLDVRKVMSITLHEVDKLYAFTKWKFDKRNIKAIAEASLAVQSYSALLGEWIKKPSNNFVKILMEAAGTETGNKTSAVVDKHRAFIKEAFQYVISQAAPHSVHNAAQENEGEFPLNENRKAVLNYAMQRLAILLKKDPQAEALKHISYKNYEGNLRLYYKNVNKGSLFIFRETNEGNHFRFQAIGDKRIIINDLGNLDNILMECLNNRLKELC